MSVWFNTDPCYNCMFIMWPGVDRWHGVTEFIDRGLICKISLKRGRNPKSLGWIYIGEYE